MAEIHQTSLSPSKLELLSRWLPHQSWYLNAGAAPNLTKAGGFRLDDPNGEVGIEFMFVRDDSGQQSTTYHVPLTYRGSPLASAESALIGTAEHGVLGRRWIYDGQHDPVMSAQIVALVQGHTRPQHQLISETPDPSVEILGKPNWRLLDPSQGAVRVQVSRVLVGNDHDVRRQHEQADDAAFVYARWRPGDDTESRGMVVAVMFAKPRVRLR